MKTLIIISKNTFKNIFTSWFTYVLIIVYLGLSAYLVIIRQWLKVLDGKYAADYEILGMPLMINFVFISLFFSCISSIGIKNGMTIFFLSRPVNRYWHFFSQWIVSLIVCLILSVIYIIFWLIIHSMIYYHYPDHHTDIFDPKYHISLQDVIVPTILLTIVLPTINVFLKNYNQVIIAILISILIGFLPMLYLFSGLYDDPSDYTYETWVTKTLLYFPSIAFSICLGLSIIFAGFSMRYLKVKV